MDEIEEVYGAGSDQPTPAPQAGLKANFSAWHHPVKQLIRDQQWAALTEKLLLKDRSETEQKALNYFTLPGADLLDVRTLSLRLKSLGTVIEYFGFDIGQSRTADGDGMPSYLLAESELRQAGHVSDNSEVLGDALEDIASVTSQAANRLRQKPVFDVINIDGCNHLSFVQSKRDKSVFDAVTTLLAHQMLSKKTWLLFLTTRVDPELMGAPGVTLQKAILENVEAHGISFSGPVAQMLSGTPENIGSLLTNGWNTPGAPLLRLVSVGLGKHILQFYHAQHNHPAKVELASAYAYCVHGNTPDMLSLAFRVTPSGVRIQSPTAKPVSVIEPLELNSAIPIVTRAQNLWDIDAAIKADPELEAKCISGSENLLRAANFDIEVWRDWVAGHPERPIPKERMISATKIGQKT
ncbi:hypothetical protein L53_01020 [Hyphomonas sp. L-53-1-40]|uniref:PP_RS20740 family protein n=1 Tax=Hyphomonas sp. L-53-1-40 TaxID=1207058 RepID=UPI000458F314|nr:hypothetical protein [Hyphomonas sp. L-53-1-40]KCZ65921.1 hypothetical protein L53_01020 [Hyphomonas sp. L-53-1-40]